MRPDSKGILRYDLPLPNNKAETFVAACALLRRQPTLALNLTLARGGRHAAIAIPSAHAPEISKALVQISRYCPLISNLQYYLPTDSIYIVPFTYRINL